MQKIVKLNSCVALIGLVMAVQMPVQAQTFTPIALTPSSFTQEIVVPNDWTYRLNAQSVTFTIDHGPTLQTDTVAGFPAYYSVDSGDTFFEIGMARGSAGELTEGLPAGGSLLTNVLLSSHVYRLPNWTSYNNNCVCLGNFTSAGTYNSLSLSGGPYVAQNYNANVNLTLNNTNIYTALSMLCSSGGPHTNTVTISYADGSTQGPVTFGVPNWFVNANTFTVAGPTGPTCEYAFTAGARCQAAENQNNFTQNTGVTSGSRLWSVDIALSDTTSYPTNLSFSWVNGNASGEVIYAISGGSNTNDNKVLPNAGVLAGPFSPIAVSGFNGGSVIPNSPQTLAGLAPLTATMDSGITLSSGGNTWFETGWDLAAPTNGFPVHGSLVTSTAFPNRTYQMAPTYHSNMCILVDSAHTLVNFAPASTNIAYTAFSLLTAGGAIGSGKVMTNYIILQHADGVNESNLFYGYDWFETTVPPAFNANERVNIGSSTSITGREVNNLDSGFPRMFDSEFPTQDGTPVTNIQAGFVRGPAAASTTYILAVSATTNFVPPATPTIYTAAQNVYSNQSAVFSVTVSVGTLPSYQWEVTDGATYTNNITNDANFSGATTSSLTIASVAPANVNYYTCLISNPAGSANSVIAPLTILVSSNSPIVLSGDAISDFYGGGYTPGEAYPSPAGLTVGNAIDETLAAYLNYGTTGNTAGFQGPVGIIVTPSAGSAVVNALRFVVAENASICDPADFSLDGSQDGINWVNVVPDQALSLPNVRNLSNTGPVNDNNQILQEVDFANSTSYNQYRLTVQNVKNYLAPATVANSMQIAEIQFLGTLGLLPPGIAKQPFPPTQKTLAGGSITWTLVANGPGPITYQWYQITNGGSTTNMIGGATANNYTLPNIQASSGGSYYCIASNTYGTTNSAVVTFTVLPAETNTYVNTILGDTPIAFLRLDEGPDNGSGNNGAAAYDIVGGHDGVYSNVVLQANPPGSYSTNDSGEAFAEFGQILDPAYPNVTVQQDNYVGGISGIDFATVTNLQTNTTSTNFTVEAWVYLNTNNVTGAGVVAQGPGGAEAWALDMGGTANAFRFYFRNAISGASTNVSTGIAPALATWYHVVGTVDESNNVASLYLNGLLAASEPLSTNLGVKEANSPISIGARRTSATTNYNDQLHGVVANVAIYNYALSSAQVANHFDATHMSPGILVQPSPLVENLQINGSFTWSIVAYGPGPLSYQWYLNSLSNPILNATNASYTANSAITSTAGTDTLYCVVSNPYGSTTSTPLSLNVLAPTSLYVSTILVDDPIAFLRLDECPDNYPNNGTIAYDSVGGHNGFYTNAVLCNAAGGPGYSANDSDDVAAQFGLLTDPKANNLTQDNCVTGVNGINFGSPSNTDSSFSIEAWVNVHGNVASAGVVSKGYGGGGEEFTIDTDGAGDAFRFYFRTAAGNSPTAASPGVAPILNTWYHVVGVLYESNNIAYESIYTNGVLGASQTLTFVNPPGLLADDSAPVVIGARSSASTTNYNLQLNGLVANVAIYNYALTASQVLNHYLGSGVAPYFTNLPVNTTVNQGQTAPATFNAVALGTTNLVYQWQLNGNNLTDGQPPPGIGGSTAVISGSTTPTLTISGATLVDNGETYTVTVVNNYGGPIQAQATLFVTATPTVLVDLPPTFVALGGSPLTLSSTWSGSPPLMYQWYFDGNPLANGPSVSGATTNVLTLADAVQAVAGTYQLVVSNAYGTNQTGQAVVSIAPYLTFNGQGSGWSKNGSAEGGYVSSGTLQLTDGNKDEAVSSFYGPVYVGGFAASFTYTDVNGRGYTSDADGTCFVLQNDARGAAAVGGDGNQLGYTGITNSVALEFNLFQGYGVFLGKNGIIVTSPLYDTLPLEIANGDPINVDVSYIGGTLNVFLEDGIQTYTYSMTTNIDIPSIIGGTTAYVGITGADGGTASTQQVSNFQFISLVDLSVQSTGNNVQVTWPSLSGVYQLQSSPDISCTNCWSNVTNAPSLSGGQNQVTLPLPAGDLYYRLQLQ